MPTREELYDQVWAEPMTKIAERYKVSGSYMARVCTILDVPRPPVGYWAKQAFGKAPARPALPPRAPGVQAEWTPGAGLDEVLPRVPRFRRAAASATSTSEKVTPLTGALEILQGSAEVDDYIKPTKRRFIDVLTSPKCLQHTIDTVTTLFEELERRGHAVMLAPSNHFHRPETDEREDGDGKYQWPRRWRADRPTVTYIKSVAIGLSLQEMSENVDVAYVKGKYARVSTLSPRAVATTWTSKHYLPSGRLRLTAYSPYPNTQWTHQWEEKTPGELRVLVEQIVNKLERAVPTITAQIKEAERQAEIRRKEWEEQKIRWEEAARVRKREELKKRRLDELVFGDWTQEHRLDAFLHDMTQRAERLEGPDRTALLEKVARARQLLQGPDSFERFRTWTPPEA